MTTISISNLDAANSDSYLQQLTDAELDKTQGGALPLVVAFAAGVAFGYILGQTK